MTNTVNIRPCAPGDENALALVGQATFLESFAGTLQGSDILAHCAREHSPAVYRDWLTDEGSRVWLAEAEPGQGPVGYLVLAPAALPIPDPRAGDLEVKRIYPLHRFHGGGIGKRLMAEATRHARSLACKRLLLGVYAGNDNAISFYQRLGFRKVGQRVFRVGSTDCNDFIMQLDL